MAYTYLIGWSELDRYYYGVRFSEKSNPKELWVSYFTSSKYVKKLAEDHGQPDIIQIRKVFETKEKAIEWETKVLRKINVIEDERWINKTDNRAIDPICANHGWSETSRRKASKTHTGMKRSESHKKSISDSLKGRHCNWLIGKKKPNHSKKMKGENNPRAIQVVYNGKTYDTIKDLSKKENLSYYLIRKMINSQEITKMNEESRNVL